MSLSLDSRFRIHAAGACSVITFTGDCALPVVPPTAAVPGGAVVAAPAPLSKSALKKAAKQQVLGEKKEKKEKPVRILLQFWIVV